MTSSPHTREIVADFDHVRVKFTAGQAFGVLNDGNTFTFQISRGDPWGQEFTVDGGCVESIRFTITGDWEIADLFAAMKQIHLKYRAACKRAGGGP
jgi:hypothetical protein